MPEGRGQRKGSALGKCRFVLIACEFQDCSGSVPKNTSQVRGASGYGGNVGMPLAESQPQK